MVGFEFIWGLLMMASHVACSSIGSVRTSVGVHPGQSIYDCVGTGYQEVLDIDMTLGMWYAVELVHHRSDKQITKGYSSVDTCPIIYLSKGGDYNRMDNGIRLVWSENAGNLYYNFNVDVDNKPGLWISSGAQNGTLTTQSMPYKQFAGIVEVTKAVGSHLVLTFCMPGQQLFSIVLSRNKTLPQTELKGVNSLLERKGLPRISTREACRNTAAISAYSRLIIYISVLYALTTIVQK